MKHTVTLKKFWIFLSLNIVENMRDKVSTKPIKIPDAIKKILMCTNGVLHSNMPVVGASSK